MGITREGKVRAMTDILRLHNVVYHTKVLGPGVRAAVWFQGCHRRCKGCMSESSRPMDGGRLVRISRLCDAIVACQDIEGITVSGGEPFLQPEALYALLSNIRKRSNLGVIIYTGFTLDRLKALEDPWIGGVLNGLADLLIDGEYVEALNDGKSLRGSSNQQLHFLTERYLPQRALYEADTRNAEVMLKENQVFFVGIPSRNTWEQWQEAVREIDRDLQRKKGVDYECGA